MDWTFRKTGTWYSLGLGVFMLLLPAVLQAQTPSFDQLRGKFDRGNVFQASFTHSYEDSYTGEENQTEGRIWIGKESYRVEGRDQVMVVDGEISRVYDRRRERLLISTYEEEDDDFAPSRMLQGVDESYMVTENNRDGDTQITLRSDDPFSMFVTVEIILDPDGIPLTILAVDQAGNRLITKFENGRFSDPGPELFELSIPEGTERVDLRH